MTYKHNGGTVDELNELLRALARCEHSDTSIAEEAADALEAAQAEIERLRAEMKVWEASFEQAAAGHATYAELTEQLVEVLEMCLETEERPEVIDFARATLAAAKQPASVKEASWNTKPSKPMQPASTPAP